MNWLCASTTLFMGTNFCISYNFHVSQDVILPFIFCNHLKILKQLLTSQLCKKRQWVRVEKTEMVRTMHIVLHPASFPYLHSLESFPHQCRSNLNLFVHCMIIHYVDVSQLFNLLLWIFRWYQFHAIMSYAAVKILYILLSPMRGFIYRINIPTSTAI